MHVHLDPMGGLAGDMFCAGLLDAFVIDAQDEAQVPDVEAHGLACRATDSMMVSPEVSKALAAAVLELRSFRGFSGGRARAVVLRWSFTLAAVFVLVVLANAGTYDPTPAAMASAGRSDAP